MPTRPEIAALLRRPNAEAMPPLPELAIPQWWRAFAALAVALIAQATVLHGLQLRGGSISFTLLVVLWFAASAGTARGAFFGLIAGACEDAVAGGSGIAWTIATPLCAAVAARIVRGIGWDHPAFLGAVAGFAALLRIVTFWLVLRAQHLNPDLTAPAVHAALWSAAFDAIAVLIATALFRDLRPRRVERD